MQTKLDPFNQALVGVLIVVVAFTGSWFGFWPALGLVGVVVIVEAITRGYL